ncbi:hypothetical protein ONZ43_g698 [Nemania bipapillata]|uniref:Uncharacterized protein n=1 Tax=Nemania bipapillata TaxID=110536 RepID=A0ACC2J7Q0_9PEZI|nr:hypothetical protein ONZ43_g698 [Nemania bipapillata]
MATSKMQSTSLLDQFHLYKNTPPGQKIPVTFHARVHAVNDDRPGDECIILMRDQNNIFLRVHVDTKNVNPASLGVAQTCTLESVLRVSGTLTLSDKQSMPEENVIAGVVEASDLVMISQAVDGLVNRPSVNEQAGGSGVLKLNERLNNRILDFTTFEIAMPIERHWTELLDKGEDFFIFAIRQLQTREKFRNLTALAKRLSSSAGEIRLGLDGDGKMHRLTFSEAKRLLKSNGAQDINEEADLTPKEEVELGRLMRDHPPAPYSPTDVFTVMEYPAASRSFQYHALPASSPGQARTTSSGDIMLRGQESATILQCYHDAKLLRAAMQASNPPVDPDAPMFQPWFEALEAGLHPNGNVAIGLNRFLQGYLGLPDIHDTALFPRDANKLLP